MKKAHLILILLILYLLPRLFLATEIPIRKDEGVYAIMIEEQIEHLTLVPTFFGYEVGWKPPLYFWLSIPFVILTKMIPFLPLELVYRSSSLFFGLAAMVPLYYIFRKFEDEEFALLAVGLYALLPISAYPESLVLLDATCLLFVLLAIWAYLEYKKGNEYFLLAGIFVFMAFFTKLVLAFVPPIVFFAYLWQNDRKTLLNKWFLLSLLAPLTAFILNHLTYSNEGQAEALYLDLVSGKLLGGLDYGLFLSTLLPLFFLTGPFLILACQGLLKHLKGNLFFTIWFALVIFPLLGGRWMPWYFLPITPPIIYFSLLVVLEDRKKVFADRFAITMLTLFVIASWLFFVPIFLSDMYYLPAKHAGKFLAGKENVLIIGNYSSGVFAYKMLEEKRQLGYSLDYGLVVFYPEHFDLLPDLIENYNYHDPRIIDGNFEKMFFDVMVYRKNTNISKFDYIAIIGESTCMPGGRTFNDSYINIYRKN
ncbi:MAG: glycosyltransferase family 39 protein [Candidatus Bilamarchaeaceae archaeon]